SKGARTLILDVGAGSGEVAGRLEERLRRAGFDVRVFALDLQWRHLAAGRVMWGAEQKRPAPAGDSLPPSRPPASAAADAFHLPFGDDSVDFAISTPFFHHFSPDENARILSELARVARRGFRVLDLRRSVVPWACVALAGRTVFRARISVQDGLASVR